MEKLGALGYLAAPVSAPSGPLPDPKSGLPILQRGMAVVERAQRGEAAAIEELGHIVEENPGMLDLRLQLAQLLTAQGRFEEALAHYERGVELAPLAANGMLIEAGRIHLRLGNFEQAEEHARAVLERLPAEGFHLLAGVAMARNDTNRALEAARQAVAAEGLPRAESLLLLARIHKTRGENVEALQVLDQLQTRVERGSLPAVPMLQFERGDALGRLGRNEEAVQAFGREIEAFPHNTRAYVHLAILYATARRFESIEPLLERMVEANPAAETMLLAASTVEGLGDEAGARRWRARAAAE
jgi:tetratricopeptide (TPR) repeat protein